MLASMIILGFDDYEMVKVNLLCLTNYLSMFYFVTVSISQMKNYWS